MSSRGAIGVDKPSREIPAAREPRRYLPLIQISMPSCVRWQKWMAPSGRR